jgi:hypothetical protein
MKATTKLSAPIRNYCDVLLPVGRTLTRTPKPCRGPAAVQGGRPTSLGVVTNSETFLSRDHRERFSRHTLAKSIKLNVRIRQP